MRSIGPALPALTLLCFYRFGMGLYLEFAVQQTSPLGYPDDRARAMHLVMTAAAYLPLLLLVYTPFLPLQDALLRGERKGFFDSVRHVLERTLPFGLSMLAQLVILATPVTLLFFTAGLAMTAIPDAPEELIAWIMLLLMIPTLTWLAIAAIYLLLATPALVLDGRGPLQSIRFSARTTHHRFWGLLGRLFVAFVLIILATVFFSFPASILAIAARVSGADPPALKIARVLWTSVITAAAFPFSVAALMVLYRSVAPSGGGAGAAAPEADGTAGAGEPRRATTPYLFE
jgi:hypothetical protein